MEVQPSKQTSVLLELGAVGYLIGAVIWVLFWIIMSYGSYRLMVDFLYIGSPLLVLSLILTGMGSFAIGKLYDKSIATTLGVVYIIAVVPFIIMGVQQMPFYMFPNVEFLLFSSLLLWAMTVWSITRRTRYSSLGTTISISSVATALIFLFFFKAFLLWDGDLPEIFSPPHFISQILSAILLHKISSGQYLKP